MAMNNIRFTYEQKNQLFGDPPKDHKEKQGIGFLISKYERNRVADEQQQKQIEKKKLVYHGNSLNYSQIYSDLRIDRREKKVIEQGPIFMESGTDLNSLHKKDQNHFQSVAAYIPKSLPKIKRNSRLSQHKQSKYVMNNTTDQRENKQSLGISRNKVFSISHYDIYKNQSKRQGLSNFIKTPSEKKSESRQFFGKDSEVLSSCNSKDIETSNIKVSFQNKAQNNLPQDKDIFQGSSSNNFLQKPALQIQPQHSLQQLDKNQIKIDKLSIDNKQQRKGSISRAKSIKQQVKDVEQSKEGQNELIQSKHPSVRKVSRQITAQQIKKEYSKKLQELDKKNQLLLLEFQSNQLRGNQSKSIKIQDISPEEKPKTPIIDQSQRSKGSEDKQQFVSEQISRRDSFNKSTKRSNSKLQPSLSKEWKNQKQAKQIKLFQSQKQQSIREPTRNEGAKEQLFKFTEEIQKVKKQIIGVRQQMHEVRQQVSQVKEEIRKERKQEKQGRRTIENSENKIIKSRIINQQIKQPAQYLTSKKPQQRPQTKQQISYKIQQTKGQKQEPGGEQVKVEGDTNRTYQIYKFSINDYIEVYQILKRIQKALKVPQLDLHNLIKESKQYLQVIAMGGLDHLQGYQMPLHRLKIIKNALLYQRISIVIVAFAYAIGKIKDCLKYLINLIGYATNNTLLILKILQGSQISSEPKNPVLAKSDRLVMKKNYDSIRNNSDIILDSIFKISKYEQAFYEPFKDILKSIGKSSIEQTFYNILQYFSFFLCVSDLHKNLPFLAVAPNPYLRESIDTKPTLVIDIIQVFCQGTKKSKNHVFRPHTQHFLNQMGQYYEIVSFTCAYPNQIDKVIDILDQKRNIKHRLYRHHALMTNNSLYKDPQRIGRDLSKLIMLDSQSILLRQQCTNTIVVPTWKGNKSDTTLAELCPILAAIALKKLDCQQAARRIHQQQLKNEHAGIKYLNFGINLE